MASNGPESTMTSDDGAESADKHSEDIATSLQSLVPDNYTSRMDDFTCDISTYQHDSSETVKYSSPSTKSFLELAHSKDIKDPSALHGCCGLYNLGNTCFMNSGLQCIMASSPLVKYFLEDFTLDEGVKDTLMGRFYILLCKVWCGQFSVIYPDRFKDTLGMYHSQFQDYRQHDCQEFLVLLLDTLHEQLTMTGSNLRCLPSNNMPASCAGSAPIINPMINSLNNMDTSPPKTTLDWTTNSTFNQSTACSPTRSTFNQSPLCSPTTSTFNQSSVCSSNSTCNQSPLGSPTYSTFNQSPLSSPSNSTFNQSHLFSPTTAQSENNAIPQPQDNMRLENINGGPDLFAVHESSSTECSSNRTEISDVTSDGSLVQVLDGEHALNLKKLKLQTENCLPRVSSSDSVLLMRPTQKHVEQSNNIRHSNVASLSSTSPIELGGKNVICSSADCKSGNLHLNNNIQLSKLPPDLLDFYCKESKTLNTNVLINEYSEEFVTTDSEKFAKQDNRFHLQTDENVLHEAAGLVDEDKTDKDQSGNNFGVKDVNLHANKKKSRFISKSCTNVLKNDYSGGDCGLNNFKRIKMDSTDSVDKCDAEQDLSKDDTEEKNVQIQALSKFNTCRKVADDTSENESCDSMEVEGNDFVDDLDSSESEAEVTSLNSIPTGATASEPKDRVCNQHDIAAADKAWEDYITDNNSIVVQSFQGQFKSTVVCFGCQHMSVMYEPFMYLSLPIPRAMERQISITLLASDSAPVCYLLKMNKHDNVLKLKQQLFAMIGKQNCDIILAEVLDSHISRILDDNVLLRYVDDSSRKIYAFEMNSPPDNTPVTQTHPTELTLPSQTSSSTEQNPSTCDMSMMNGDIFSDVGTFADSKPHSLFTDNKPDPQFTCVEMRDVDTAASESGQRPAASTVTSIDLAESSVNQSDCTNTNQSKYDDLGGKNLWDCSYVGFDTEPLWDDRNDTRDENPPPDVTSGIAGIIDQWRSCAICLEELSDNELLVHTCGGTFCQNCLEMSMKHSSDSAYCCPICLSPASVVDDFVPLPNSESHKPKLRMIAVPVAFRRKTSDNKLRLFGHPNILYLPNKMTRQQLYGKVDKLLPYPLVYTIVLTDGQGLHCSRCMYTTHCSGCPLDGEGEVTLQPSDHLTVQVEKVDDSHVEEIERVHDHVSMDSLRHNEQITIYDCFRAFTQSEVLDEHNPWYCPQCQQNQCAKKTMTVWRYPDCLIVHLKRFVFHEFSSLKIDNQVIYPHKNLDLTDFISGPTAKDLTYDLYSIVCHFGGAHSGHYSSYSRHPLTSEWFYYNDDTVIQQTPMEDDFSSAYVLFYQRQGTHSEVQPTMCLPRMVIDDEPVDTSMLNNGTIPYEPQTCEAVYYGPQTFEAASYGPQPYGPQPSYTQCSDETNKTEDDGSKDSKIDTSFDFYS